MKAIELQDVCYGFEKRIKEDSLCFAVKET